MKNNDKGILLGVVIISLLVLLAVSGSLYSQDKSSELIFTGVYLQCWGLMFLLSYFFSHKTFFFRALIWLCENFSSPKGRKMAFFYFALAFGLGSMSILQGIAEAKHKPSKEIVSQNTKKFCNSRPPVLQEFSRHDSQNLNTTVLLSTSFEPKSSFSSENISPFIMNSEAPLSVTANCSHSGKYSLNVIPRQNGFLKRILPLHIDKIDMGSTLSASFNSSIPFDVTKFRSVKLSFARYSTSNQDKREDFNCGTSLNIYYRLDGYEWLHKMAYCGQYITETTGWKNSELIFDTQKVNTIEFLFVYEALSIAKNPVNPVCYLIDDLKITGKK